VLRIEIDGEEVVIAEVVATPQQRGGTLRILHLRGEVNRLIVVNDAQRRAHRRRFAIVRIVLREVGELRRALPHSIRQITVDARRYRRAHRLQRRTIRPIRRTSKRRTENEQHTRESTSHDLCRAM